MDDQSLMLRALRLARRGEGAVEPNPLVGCVLARGGRILGEGYHRRFGGPHAEVEALVDARRRGHDPAGCDAFVTLEPCCHHGKTPPCTDALIAARVGRVVAAMEDPHPAVAGGGIAALRAAGVAVEVGLCEAQARRLNEAWLKRVTTGLPWVIAKWAQSLDGRIAAASGDSRWVSNELSREFVHVLRGRVDAVLVGVGTVMADDPRLTARPRVAGRVRRVARRVVIDPRLRLPPDAALLREAETAPVLVATAADLVASPAAKLAELEARGIEVLPLPTLDAAPSHQVPGRLDLRPLLRHLVSKHAATNVLAEGGATLLGSLLAQGLVDQALVFVAPALIGDAAAVPAVRGLACSMVSEAQALRLMRVRRFGEDVLLDYRVGNRAAPAPGSGG